MLYFDHNATSPLHPVAREAWLAACEHYIGNPASQHRLGQRAERALEEANECFACLLGTAPDQLVWTSGATESINSVLYAVATAGMDPRDEVWLSAIEHSALRKPAQYHFGDKLRVIPVDSVGVISLEWISENLKRRKPKLIAVMAVNNETGVIQPWEKIAELCYDEGIPYLCDATQWIGKLPGQYLGNCGFFVGSSHKFGGPRGVGFLKLRTNTRWKSLIMGGPQQGSRRAGTENVPGVVATAAVLQFQAAALARGEQNNRAQHRDFFEQQLLANFPGCSIIGSDALRLWNTSLVLPPGGNCQFRWIVKLDKEGCVVSSGSACASGTEEPSHVLTAMGFSHDRSSNVIRASSGWETSADHWRALAEKIAAIAGSV